MDALVLTKLENLRYATDIRPLHSIFFVDNYRAVVAPEMKPYFLDSELDRNLITTKMPWVNYLALPSFVPNGTSVDVQADLVKGILKNNVTKIGYDSLFLSLYEKLIKI